VDPNRAGRIYAGTGEANIAFRERVVRGDRLLAGQRGRGLLRTSNYGNRWTLLGTKIFSDSAFADLAVSRDNNARIFAATTTGLFISNDEGESWVKQILSIDEPAVSSVVVSQARPGVAFAAVWGVGIFKSGSVGSVSSLWTKLEDGLPLSNIGRIKLAWSNSNPNFLVAWFSTADHFHRGLYFSDDEGKKWTRIDGIPDLLRGEGFFHILLGIHPTDANVIYMGGAGARQLHQSSLFRGTRIEQKWFFEPVGGEIHTDFHAVAFDQADPRRIFVSSGGGIWRTDNAGSTWESCNDGLGITQLTYIAQHPSRADIWVVGTQDNGTLLHDLENGWQHVDGGDGGFVAVDHTEPNIIYDEFRNYRIARSSEGGRPNTFIPIHPVIGVEATAFFAPFELNPDRQSEIALGADKLYISENRGLSWSAIPFAFVAKGETIRSLRYSDSRTIYIGTSAGLIYEIIRNTDGKWAVQRLTGLEDLGRGKPINAIGVIPSRSKQLLVALETNDGPPLWSIEVLDKAGAAIRSISGTGAGALRGPVYTVTATREGRDIYVGTEIGVSVSNDFGITWSQAGLKLPNVAVFDLQEHPKFPLLRAATFGRGLWELDLLPPR
jgi:hypothetical protein